MNVNPEVEQKMPDPYKDAKDMCYSHSASRRLTMRVDCRLQIDGLGGAGSIVRPLNLVPSHAPPHFNDSHHHRSISSVFLVPPKVIA